MKLFYTTTSPYARKARIAAIEKGLTAKIELVLVTVRDPDSELLAHSPVGTVPALMLDDGTVLSESAIVCDCFERLGEGETLLPASGAERWAVLRREGIALGLLAGLVVWVREMRRPEAARSASTLALETGRVARCLDALEMEAPTDGADIDLARITLGCALGVLDFRLGFHDWRAGRPRLAAWYETFRARPSMQATEPHE